MKENKNILNILSHTQGSASKPSRPTPTNGNSKIAIKKTKPGCRTTGVIKTSRRSSARRSVDSTRSIRDANQTLSQLELVFRFFSDQIILEQS